MARANKIRPSAFSKDYAPYGRYEGKFGTPEDWAKAFKIRMSPEEIEEILRDESPWGILGVAPGATQAEIKTAYRKRALETHPDRNPDKADGEAFKKVQAAYEKLT